MLPAAPSTQGGHGFSSSTSVSMFKTYSGDSGASSASYLLKASQCGTQSLRDCIALEATLKNSAADTKVANLTLTSTESKKLYWIRKN